MQPNLVDFTLPSALDAERAVLASIMIDNNLMNVAADSLQEEFFFRDSHRQLWVVFRELHRTGSAIDMVTVCNGFPHVMTRVGGPAFVASILDGGVPVANLDHHTILLRETFAKREAIKAACNIMVLAGQDEPLVEYENRLRGALAAIQTHSVLPVQPGGEAAMEAIVYLDDVNSGTRQLNVIKTGFHDFDNFYGGLLGGELVILASRPSVGKSSWATTVQLNAAMKGKRSLIFSLEMPARQIVNRFLSRMAGVDGHKLTMCEVDREEMARLCQAQADFSKFPIKIADRQNVTVQHICSLAKRERDRFGLDLLIVDYLQLVQAGIRTHSRREELEYMTRTLKSAALELDVPVLALSQLSRDGATGEPESHHLREAGIEGDADKIILGWMPEEDEPHIRKFKIPKNRNGRTGYFDLLFQGEYTTFHTLDHNL